MAGKAPSPYCGMLLSDFGADVIIVDRVLKTGPKSPNASVKQNPLDRGKRSMRIDLKSPDGLEILKNLVQDADVLLESFRPNVMESLGLGPDEAHRINPGLIYARFTGYGQEGPYSVAAGHDINYLASTGALSLFRRKGETPLPPCNILGDFAGGGLMGAFGILLALIDRNKSGKGQVVDAAMIDGVANLSTVFFGLLSNNLMSPVIGTNLLDSGAPYYQVYETADGKFMAVGAIEGKFHKQLLKGLGIDPASLPDKRDVAKWPETKQRFAEIFKKKTRDEWKEIFKGKDACVNQVLEMNEVDEDPHNHERELLVGIDGMLQPAPAPRLSRTPGRILKAMGPRGSDTRDILKETGYSDEEIDRYLKSNIIESFDY